MSGTSFDRRLSEEHWTYYDKQDFVAWVQLILGQEIPSVGLPFEWMCIDVVTEATCDIMGVVTLTLSDKYEKETVSKLQWGLDEFLVYYKGVWGEVGDGSYWDVFMQNLVNYYHSDLTKKPKVERPVAVVAEVSGEWNVF